MSRIRFALLGLLIAAVALALAAQQGQIKVKATSPAPSPTASQTNFALNARLTTSSSEERGSWSAKFAVDGQRDEKAGARGWSSFSQTDRNHTEWIRLDLGGTHPLARVDLFPRNDPARLGEGFPIDFQIQISVDGSNWITVIDKAGYPKPGNAVQSFPFASQNARYVQIIGRNLRYLGAENAYYLQFAEIEIY